MSEGGSPAASGVNSAMLASMNKHSDHGGDHGMSHASGSHQQDSLGIGGQMEPFNMQEGISLGTIGSAAIGDGLQAIQGAFNKSPTELGPAAEPFGVGGVGFIEGKDIKGCGDVSFQSIAPGKQLNAPANVPGLLPAQQGQGH